MLNSQIPVTVVFMVLFTTVLNSDHSKKKKGGGGNPQKKTDQNVRPNSETVEGSDFEFCMFFIQPHLYNFLLLPFSHLCKHPLYNNTDRRYRKNSGFELFMMF